MSMVERTPDEIARGLTEAQRQALANSKMQFGTLRIIGAPSTLHSMKRKGLTGGPFADVPTDLGLQVRAMMITAAAGEGG